MSDPDFEAGRNGGMAPPNGDWSKFLEGSRSRPIILDPGFGPMLGVALILALLLMAAPVVVGAAAMTLVLSLIISARLRHRSWSRSVAVLAVIGVLAIALGTAGYLGAGFLSSDPAMAQWLSHREPGVDGWMVSVPSALFWALAFGPAALIYLGLCWMARPVKRPARLATQVFAFVVLTVLLAVCVSAAVFGTVFALEAFGLLSPQDAAGLSAGIVGTTA